MERISSSFFMLSLLMYYIPKLFKLKKSRYVIFHIFTGSISIITMITAFILKIGQDDFIKYIGFSIIMILIGITGYLLRKKPKLYRKLHIIFTISFFVYLFISIKFF